MTDDVSQWRDRIALCLGVDREPLTRQLDKIARRVAQDKPFDRELKVFWRGWKNPANGIKPVEPVCRR